MPHDVARTRGCPRVRSRRGSAVSPRRLSMTAAESTLTAAQTSHRPTGDQRTTRVLVVDDHSIVRAGVRVLLASTEGFEVVGEASEGMEAVHEARTVKPDVVVLDITLRGTRS